MRFEHLDRQITIEQVSTTRGANGSVIETWSTFASPWAKKTDINGTEKFQSDQRLSEVNAIFRIRYRPGVTTKMRILYDDVYYDIQGPPKEIGRREYLDILTKCVGG